MSTFRSSGTFNCPQVSSDVRSYGVRSSDGVRSEILGLDGPLVRSEYYGVVLDLSCGVHPLGPDSSWWSAALAVSGAPSGVRGAQHASAVPERERYSLRIHSKHYTY